MSRLPRLAVGTIQPGADPQTILWALMEVLRRAGLQVQSFLSRSHFPRQAVTVGLTGLNVRHLDSWLMSPEVCRDLFLRGCHAADVALVEGQFASAAGADGWGGRLEPLCRWLDLPRLIVIDASAVESSHLPRRPKMADGLLLDRITDDRHLATLRTELEALWGVPVLGALARLPQLRSALDAVPSSGRVPQELCESLGNHFAAVSQLERIWQLALERELPSAPVPCCCSVSTPGKLTVAIAYDEAFRHYFPDALDLLELRGAAVVDFSPLRDEALPPGTDIVYLGCGCPERYARALSENHCISAALRNHVRRGGRIYSEGGGAAYLCQHMEAADGQCRRMVGILPAVARLQRPPQPAEPVELRLAQPSWLGDAGVRLRGYRNPNWQFEPTGPLSALAHSPLHRYEVVGAFGAIGSLVHLNFAAQRDALQRFFCPERCQRDATDPWAPVG